MLTTLSFIFQLPYMKTVKVTANYVCLMVCVFRGEIVWILWLCCLITCEGFLLPSWTHQYKRPSKYRKIREAPGSRLADLWQFQYETLRAGDPTWHPLIKNKYEFITMTAHCLELTNSLDTHRDNQCVIKQHNCDQTSYQILHYDVAV